MTHTSAGMHSLVGRGAARLQSLPAEEASECTSEDLSHSRFASPRSSVPLTERGGCEGSMVGEGRERWRDGEKLV